MQTLAPASVSTWAAMPPPAPEPTTTTSYVFGLAFTCAMYLLATSFAAPLFSPEQNDRLMYKLPYLQKDGRDLPFLRLLATVRGNDSRPSQDQT